MLRSRRTWLIAVALVGACAEDGECEQPLHLCEIDDASCQEHVFVQTACAREFEGRDVPPVRSITRAEFEDELRGDGPPPTEADVRSDRQLATALRMLWLLPDDATSNDEASIEAYARNVLAFYSREDEGVTIVSTNLGDAVREQQVYVLSHEFVHAQQDVDVGLQPLFDEYATSLDSGIALRSLTEGEAVHYSNLTIAHQRNHSIDEQSFASYYADREQERERDARDPLVDFTTLTQAFPYAFGAHLVTERWYAEGSQGVLAMYDAPPSSTADVLRQLAGLSATTPDMPELSAEPLPEGWTVLADDTFGAWVGYAVALRTGEPASRTVFASEWLGDRIIVVGGENEADVALAWRIRFASGAGAASFDAFVAAEGVEAHERIGTLVTIVVASSDEVLTTWQDIFTAAQVDDAAPRSSAPDRVRKRIHRVRPWHASTR